jgi:hypothetical protein
MAKHDGHMGQLLYKLDELSIRENTIVMYSTDNGAKIMGWPDGGMIPFRGEKNTTWEGGFRLPMMVRWPGKIETGAISNEIIAQMDWIPTQTTAAAMPTSRKSSSTAIRWETRTSRCTSTATTSSPTSQEGPPRDRGRSSSTSPTNGSLAHSLQGLESDVQHPGSPRLRGLGEALYQLTCSVTLQPAPRSLRESG